jgi:hypothetical protein
MQSGVVAVGQGVVCVQEYGINSCVKTGMLGTWKNPEVKTPHKTVHFREE